MNGSMKKDNAEEEMQGKTENKNSVKVTGKKEETKSIKKYLLAILIFIIVIFIVMFINTYFKINERVYEDWLRRHGELENMVSGENEIGERLSGEDDIAEMVSGEESKSNKTQVKSSINGRIETGGYDESGISYKSYDGVKSIQNFELTNLKVGKINDSKCIILADTKNISKEFQKSIKVKISVIDELDNVKETFSAILDELAGLETGKFKAQVLSDVTYAKDFKIEVVNE